MVARRTGAVVVAKLGAEGALVHDGSSLLRLPAPLVEVVDTTGAGDSFNAAFVAALIRGQEVPAAAEGAVAAASALVAAQPSAREAVVHQHC